MRPAWTLTVIEASPTEAADEENSTLEESPLVTVSDNPPKGADEFKLTRIGTCKFCPTVAFWATKPEGTMLIVTALEPPAGRAYPIGGVAVTVVLPDEVDVKVVVAEDSPPTIVTEVGLGLPTPAVELVKATGTMVFGVGSN